MMVFRILPPRIPTSSLVQNCSFVFGWPGISPCGIIYGDRASKRIWDGFPIWPPAWGIGIGSRNSAWPRSRPAGRTFLLVAVRRDQHDLCDALQPKRVRIVDWLVHRVLIEINPTGKIDRVLSDKPTWLRIVISRPVEVESGLWIELSSRIAERISERTRGCGLISERIESIGLRQCSGCIAQRCDRAEPIGAVVAGRA